MREHIAGLLLLLISGSGAAAQTTYPYYLEVLAGSFPSGDGGPATSGLLDFPWDVVPDAAGNLYILDSGDYLIRKVSTNGRISSIAFLEAFGHGLRLGPDGNLYVAAEGEVIKVALNGATSVIAGTGTIGHTGDGGAATSAQVGYLYGIAFDAAGDIFVTEETSTTYYIREITTDGKIQTVAGTQNAGFNGDNQPAAAAELNFPRGIAVDSAGNVYFCDDNNQRVRKFAVGGNISTVVGNGKQGPPVNGPATATPLGFARGLWLDASGNLIISDAEYGAVLEVSASGTLTRIAGNLSNYGSGGDGPATSVSLIDLVGVSEDSSGNVYLAETENHLIRKVTPGGNLVTVAGRVHFAGDGGPAVSAILNGPIDMALDPKGNVYIADSSNYRIREVTPNGTINTIAGVGLPGMPVSGSAASGASLPLISTMTNDSGGNLYIANNLQVWKISTGGTITLVAGNGTFGDAGDGGPAASALFESIAGLAVDGAGNVYIADAAANRVRMVSAASGTISAFAGTGKVGFSGDGGLATAALFNFDSPGLGVDPTGNVYITDGFNYRVRMVNPQGIISTIVGNGRFGDPTGGTATGSVFNDSNALAVDGSGNLYIASVDYAEIYQLSGGIIHRISGGGYPTLVDGTPALEAYFFATGIKANAAGDVFAVDNSQDVVLQLIVNSPSSFTMSGGNKQTAPGGRTLASPLTAQLTGRAGVALAGISVNFAVTSGSATLSAASTLTDTNGMAGVSVTLGATAGSVTITATAAGLPPVQFTETATAACTVPVPVVASANSATDFGALPAMAPGSWIEIKGSNLAQSTRQWASGDFNGSNAPTSLDGVSVTIDGKSAFVSYISPQQINVQAPADSASGSVPVVVTTASCPSDAFTAQEYPVIPGVLAPASFVSGRTQYMVAILPDGTYVGNPNLIPGAAFRPAAPGDTITAYGIGFGPVNPASAQGTVTAGANALEGLTVTFGSTAAKLLYAGLAPGYVGLYQFDIVVPNVANGDVPVTFEIGGVNTTQNVFLTIHN